MSLRLKPFDSVSIDPGSDLAQSLAVSLLFNERAGEPWDAAGGRAFPASNPGVWSAGRDGPVRYATGGTSAVEIPASALADLLRVGGGFSIRIVFRFRTLTADYTTLTDSTGRQFSLFLDTAGNGNFAITSVPGFGFVAGTWYDFVITRTTDQSVGGGNHSSAYLNGAYRSDVTGIGVSAISGDLCFGRNASGGGAHADCDYALIQVWVGRALTAGEVAALHDDPWSIYRRPAARRLFATAGGGGGGSIGDPYFYRLVAGF